MRNASKLLALVLAFVMVLGIVPVASAQTVHTHGIEEYPEIELGVETVFEIAESGETVYVRYTPEVTAEYTFASSGANGAEMIDPEGFLYDSEMNLLASHSDNSGIDFNFTLVYTLEAGKTYVYAAKLFSTYRAGVEFYVTLTADLPESFGEGASFVLCHCSAFRFNLILKDYLRGRMPEDMAKKFAEIHKGEESDFLNKLYKEERPNYYLASFARFAIENKSSIIS